MTMTYRERREARAERLREWAAKREAKADATRASVKQLADMIPFGQPILVGHHSERHARRDQDRIVNGMRSSIADRSMAESMSSRADEIERAARQAVYDDDPDAIEALTAKVAALEARRDKMKAANEAYRAEHRAELKAMTAYERSQAVPYASYALTNIGATIRQKKQRIVWLTAQAAIVEQGGRGTGRMMAARFASDCADCGGRIEKGSTINYYRATREAVHSACPDA